MDYLTSMDSLAGLAELTGALAGISSGILSLIALSGMGTIILAIVSKWKIFEKADLRGWAALIPFYGRYVLYDMTWESRKLLFFLISYIPGVSYVMNVITMVKLACAFDKNSVFAVGLLFCEPVFLAILGFDDSEYVF